MKKLLLATSCLALSSTISMAADMGVPYTKAPVMAAPVFSWTGCYVGAHVGAGSLSTNGSGFANSEGGFTTTTGGASGNGNGAIGGGQLGCNYQDGNWVFGLEGEGFWSGIKSTQNQTFSAGSSNGEGITMKNSNDFTIAARAGIAFDRTFIYGKGGWAWGNYKVDQFAQFSPTNIQTVSQSGYLDGLLVGVGIEHALTRNWTVKLEYDYIAYGSRQLTQTFCSSGSSCSVGGTTPISSNKQLIKVGVNYLFDVGGAPLVAKY
jgi:outer membrane immunogenic protein